MTLNSLGGVFALQEVFPICQQITVLIYVFKIQIFSPSTIELLKKKKKKRVLEIVANSKSINLFLYQCHKYKKKLHFTTQNYIFDYILHPKIFECIFCTPKL